jgi:phage gp29-like protein
MAVELLEAARTGTVTYQDLCEYFDRAVSKILLGQTLTSEPGSSGSYSLGQVHNDVRLDIVKSDADSMCETINRTVVRWIVDYNFPAADRTDYPRVWRRTEPEQDLAALANRDKVLLVDLGMADRVPESYISETYGLPLAKVDEPTVGQPQAAQSVLANGADARAATAPAAEQPRAGAATKNAGDGDEPPEDAAKAAFAERATQQFGQDAIDDLARRAAIAGQDAIGALLKPALDFIEEAESFEEIGEHLYGLYPQLDSARFQELLARAMFASTLTGYGASVQESSDGD